MLALTLSLAAALSFGGGDYLGGFISRRSSPITTTMIAQTTGLVLAVTIVWFWPGEASRAAFFWGGLSGLAGSTGLVFYFRALSIGNMGVVAPLSSLVSAALPVTAAVMIGERPGPYAAAGIGLGIIATILVSRSEHDEEEQGPKYAGMASSLFAGVCFGIFYLALDRAPDGSGLWPLLAGRLGGIPVLIGLLVLSKMQFGERRNIALSMLSGTCDIAGNILFLLATRVGLLALTSVVTGLYPVFVVIFARIFLNEKLAKIQIAGVVLALIATTLIAL